MPSKRRPTDGTASHESDSFARSALPSFGAAASSQNAAYARLPTSKASAAPWRTIVRGGSPAEPRDGEGGQPRRLLSCSRPDPDLAVGPASDEAYPHRYDPAFVAEIGRCAAGGDSPEPLRCVASGGGADLFMFPPAATDALAELTPERPDFTNTRLDEIADRLMASPALPPRAQRGGARTAVLTLRGHCLEARTVSGRELYYWFWQRAEGA